MFAVSACAAGMRVHAIGSCASVIVIFPADLAVGTVEDGRTVAGGAPCTKGQDSGFACTLRVQVEVAQTIS